MTLSWADMDKLGQGQAQFTPFVLINKGSESHTNTKLHAVQKCKC